MELARRYSNNLELLSSLTRTWSRLHHEPERETPGTDLVLRSASRRPNHQHAVRRRLAPATVAALIADYQAGTSSLALAQKYGIAKSSVLRLLDAHQVPRRHQPVTAEQITAARLLYESGLSAPAVADRLGAPERTVYNTLKRAGAAMRDTHGRARGH